MQEQQIIVKDKAYGTIIETVARVIHPASGWQWCWYKGRRYQVHGGIRTPLAIHADYPIETRAETAEKTALHFPYAKS